MSHLLYNYFWAVIADFYDILPNFVRCPACGRYYSLVLAKLARLTKGGLAGGALCN